MIENLETLYPPIIDTMMPVWAQLPDAADEFFVEYDLSPYQENYYDSDYFGKDDSIHHWKYSIQAVVNDQNTNDTTLDRDAWPQGIICKSIGYPNGVNKNNFYSDFISMTQIGDKYNTGMYYRIQLRLMRDPFYVVSVDGHKEYRIDYDDESCTLNGEPCTYSQIHAIIVQDSQDAEPSWIGENYTGKERNRFCRSAEGLQWLNENGFLSEWSTVCLVRKINVPQVYVYNINIDDQPTIHKGTSLVQIDGRIFIPPDGLEPETITEVTLSMTGLGEAEGINEVSPTLFINSETSNSKFSYKFKTLFSGTEESPNNYSLTIKYKSRNGYIGQANCIIQVAASSAQYGNVNSFNYEPDNIKGFMNIQLVMNAHNDDKKYIICRSDGFSNFTLWEELFIVDIPASLEEQTFYLTDVTAESGIWYKYTLQVLTSRGDKGQVWDGYQGLSPKMPFYEDYYFTNSEGHLCISFDRTLSNFQNNIQETKVETIGSRFPYVFRNGHINYRTFSLNGVISYNDNNETALFSIDAVNHSNSYMGYQDGETPFPQGYPNNLYEEQIHKGFKTREDLFPITDIRHQYDIYNAENNINTMNDITLEREFRKSVMQFLQSGNPILFKSAAEGNVLVRLLNFTFSPKNSLNNIVYDFSCTAVEIDECTVDNYIKYNIQLSEIPSATTSVEPTIETIIEQVGQI